MGLKHLLQTLTTNHCETSDRHAVEALRTHYYKTTAKKAFVAIQELITRLDNYSIESLSEEHGEIGVLSANGKKAFVVITIVAVRPFSTAVDFSVSTDTKIPTDFGHSQKVAIDLYKQIDNTLPLEVKQ